MKILYISKSGKDGGGASRAITCLKAGIEQLNLSEEVQFKHFVAYNNRELKEDLGDLFKPDFKNQKRREKIQKATRNLGLFDFFPFDHFLANTKEIVDWPDIIHFHDILDTISPKFINHLCKKGKPIVWTFHDCSPFTGGCLYPGACTRHQSPHKCGKCPIHGHWPIHGKYDFTKQSLKAKSRLYKKWENKRLFLTTPSQWMANEAYQANEDIKNLPTLLSYGIDIDTFSPSESRTLSKKLNVPKDNIIILFTAGAVYDPRKGFADLCKAVRLSKRKDITIFAVGRFSPEASLLARGTDTHFLGSFDEEKDLARIYNQCDLMACPSHMDNSPLTVLESIACGIPVLAYDSGGIPERILPGKTGWIVPSRDISALSEAIKTLSKQACLSMNGPAREYAEKHFSLKKYASEHLSFYREILEQYH